jgi:hypothetical protein
MLAAGAIGVLWLATLRTEPFRRHLVHLAALAPQILLPLWYMGPRSETSYAQRWNAAFAWRYLRHLEVLWTFGLEQLRFGTLVAALFALLAALAFLRGNLRSVEGAERTLRLRFDEVDGFLLLAGILTVLFFLAPGAAGGGSLVQERLSLYPWLALVPWLAARLRPGRGMSAALAGLLIAATLWNTLYLTRWYRRLDRETAPYLAGLERAQPHTRIVSLLFDRNGSAARVSPFGHLISRTALAKGLIDWDNHEASSDHFPVRFKPPIVAPDLTAFYVDPANVRLRGWQGKVDYLYAWQMPRNAPVARRLHRHYRLVARGGGGQLFAIEP